MGLAARLRSARGRCGLKHPVNNPRLGKRPVMKDGHDEQSATHDLTNTALVAGRCERVIEPRIHTEYGMGR